MNLGVTRKPSVRASVRFGLPNYTPSYWRFFVCGPHSISTNPSGNRARSCSMLPLVEKEFALEPASSLNQSTGTRKKALSDPPTRIGTRIRRRSIDLLPKNTTNRNDSLVVERSSVWDGNITRKSRSSASCEQPRLLYPKVVP